MHFGTKKLFEKHPQLYCQTRFKPIIKYLQNIIEITIISSLYKLQFNNKKIK
jgi:hypothetical protein